MEWKVWKVLLANRPHVKCQSNVNKLLLFFLDHLSMISFMHSINQQQQNYKLTIQLKSR